MFLLFLAGKTPPGSQMLVEYEICFLVGLQVKAGPLSSDLVLKYQNWEYVTNYFSFMRPNIDCLSNMITNLNFNEYKFKKRL